MRKTTHTKAQIISVIKSLARRLKRTPTRSEFERLSGIHWMKVQRLFGGYRAAVREAGLEPDPGGIRIDTAAMLADFGRVARNVKRQPTRDEYEKLGKYAGASLETRFRRWSAVRESFLEYVTRNGLEREWGDVAESLRNGPVPRRGGGKAWLKPKNALPRIAADERGSESRSKSLKHRGMEETEENWAGEGGVSELSESANGSDALAGSVKTELLPQMNADEHGSKVLLPRINANNKEDRGSRPEPVRAEILYPQLRGMRCVTHVMLWMISMQQSSQQHNAQFGNEAGITADRADGRGLQDMSADRSVCATRSTPGENMSAGRNLSATGSNAGKVAGAGISACPTEFWDGETPPTRDSQSHAGEIISTESSVCATRIWGVSLERALYFPKRIIPGRPLMGPPLLPFFSRSSHKRGEPLLAQHGMAYEPVNEMGVVFLFGMVAPLLGFRVEALQTGFPDCKAKLEVEPGRWQDVNVEFEFESRKFRDHHHDPDKCDIIVCWRHNWKGCPERIQVVELSSILGVR